VVAAAETSTKPRRAWYTRPVLVGFAVLAAIFGITALASGGFSNSQPAPVNQASPSTTRAAAAQAAASSTKATLPRPPLVTDSPAESPGLPKVGTKLTTPDGASVQVLTFGPVSSASNGTTRPEAAASLVAIDVEACASPTGSTKSFNPQNFTLNMTDRTTVTAALGAVDGQIDPADQAPSQCIRGKVGFELPSGETPAAILFRVPRVPLSPLVLLWVIGK
jgi:hypothetical protein